MDRKFIIIYLLLILGVFSSRLYGQVPKKLYYENKVISAVALFNEHNFTEASTLLKEVIHEDSSNDAAYYYEGLIAIYNNNIDRAESMFKKAYQIDPKNYWYKLYLANIYDRQHKSKEAISLLEALIKEKPKQTELYERLILLYYDNDNLDKSLACLNKLDTLSGTSERSVMLRYYIYMAQQQVDKALNILNNYEDKDNSTSILSLLGDYAKSQSQDSLALKYYKAALSLEKDNPKLIDNYASIAMWSDYKAFIKLLKDNINNSFIDKQVYLKYIERIYGDPNNSIYNSEKESIDSLIADIAEKHPYDTSYNIAVSRFYYRNQEFDKIKALFKKASYDNPDSLKFSINYTNILAMLKEYKEAAQEAEKAFKEHFPTTYSLLLQANAYHFELKDYDSIIRNCEYILKHMGDDKALKVFTLSTLGDSYHFKGENRKAYKAYNQVLKLDPNNTIVLNNYAYYLALENRRLKKALKMSKKAVDLDSSNATLLDTYAWILHLLGRNDEAKSFLKQALIYDSNSSRTLLEHYAEILKALGEDDLAQYYIEQAKNKKD